MTTTIVQTVATREWLFVLDSEGRVWERPSLDATGLKAVWEPLPPLPGGALAITLSSEENVIYATAEGGSGLYRYLSETWEDVTPPFDKGPPQ